MANKQYHKVLVNDQVTQFHQPIIISSKPDQNSERSELNRPNIFTIQTNFQKIYGLLKKLLEQEEVPLEYNIPPPIWVIDEANMFSQLEGSEEGEVLLKSILNWMVANTKEKGRFHIVLTSSDPFFFNWIVDIYKKEAEEYFEKHVLPRYGCKELEGNVRRITGTRMMIIDKYVKEYKNCEGELESYESEYNKLRYGLHPNHPKS
ncbi:hypothetical protein RhiirC2_793486 [Rhizophagus irregularis]|uniref:ATPase domain-containing protein n=1 Tax=Rhizophagus irregularis TaxID=588596 RepID=A0A2N1MFC2_9GLOM|nr:hypothetical protein RhiirC2_793486 [Rhizophagus irregularis]